jgi:tetrahydromethanopterin S-methyltransferase subunit H
MAFIEDQVRKLDFVEDTYTHPIIVDFCEGEVYVSGM